MHMQRQRVTPFRKTLLLVAARTSPSHQMASRSARVLLNPLANRHAPTPSSNDGVSAELERDLRFYGALLIQQAGILLKLPQIVMSTASTLFQRFFFVTSFHQFGIREISAGCLFLASKLEEQSLRIRDLINVYDYTLSLITWISSTTTTTTGTVSSCTLPESIRQGLIRNLQEKGIPLPPNLKVVTAEEEEEADVTVQNLRIKSQQPSEWSDQEETEQVDVSKFKYEVMTLFSTKYYNQREEIVVSEMQILKRLGFHVQVQHPYGAMINYLSVLGLTHHDTIPQQAWNYLNDSLLTTLPALYPTTHIATLSIYLSIETSRPRVTLPNLWWQVFDVDSEVELQEMKTLLQFVYDDNDKKSVWQRVMGLPITKHQLRSRLELTQ